MDRIDRSILRALQSHARISNVDLATLVGYRHQHALGAFLSWKKPVSLMVITLI